MAAEKGSIFYSNSSNRDSGGRPLISEFLPRKISKKAFNPNFPAGLKRTDQSSALPLVSGRPKATIAEKRKKADVR
jgi:hypothetical protein